MAKCNKSHSVDLSTTSGTGPSANGRVGTKSTATMNGLTGGQRVWFRVAAGDWRGRTRTVEQSGDEDCAVRMRPTDAAY